MEKQELDILIDKSILGTLTQNEKSKLDAYIMEQPTTKLEIQMRADIMRGLEYNMDQDLKSLLNKIHKEEITNPNRKITIRIIGFILICFVLIFGIYSLTKFFNNTPEAPPLNNSGLYATYFEPYSPSLETRDNDQNQDETYLEFINAYRSKDFNKSLEIVKPILQAADDKTLFLAGISAMQLDRFEESIIYLDEVINGDGFYFIDHAKWYKSLVLIKMNKLNEAKILLKSLADNPKADHHDESVSLLKEL